MLRVPVRPRETAALLAAALLILALSCGGDGDRPATSVSPTPSASLTPSTSPTTAPTARATTEPIVGAVNDLASDPPPFTAIGGDSEDLIAVPTMLSTGDFNGDGAADIVIGAPQADGPDNSREDAGEAYVIFGPPEGVLDLSSEEADLVIIGASAGDGLGFSVLGGDVNGDGTDDVIIGAPGVTAGEDPRTDQGRTYVFFGRRGLSGELDLSEDVFDFVVTGAEGFSRVGHAIAQGDVNGDGVNDLILGAPFAGREPGTPPGSTRTHVGEVYVVFGSDELSGEVSIPSLEQDATLSGKEAFGQFGAAVAAADIDGDGVDDIIVGANRSSGNGEERAASGAIYIFAGGGDLRGPLSIADDDQTTTILGAVAGNAFGFPIVTGDFNGDGTADVAAGAQVEARKDQSAAGVVHIFFGGSDLRGTIDLAETPADVRIGGARAGEFLPSSMARADVNGDGTDDLVLGASVSDAPDGRQGAGRVYLILGSRGLESMIDLAVDAPTLTIVGIEGGDRLGTAVAASDVSGDGRIDLILVASDADGEENERPEAGEVYVITPSLP